MLASLLFATAALTAAAPQPTVAPATRAALEATCFDYLDGQLQGDPERVARSVHPDLAKRRVVGDTGDERLGLRRMSKDELVALTRQGVLKRPEDQWDSQCTVLDVAGEAAVVRADTPWFTDFFHMGRYGERWIIINALWHTKKPVEPAASAAP